MIRYSVAHVRNSYLACIYIGVSKGAKDLVTVSMQGILVLEDLNLVNIIARVLTSGLLYIKLVSIVNTVKGLALIALHPGYRH